MQWPDLINGSYECLGSIAVALSIKQVLRDRVVRGVHWGTTLFFTTWGYWNLFYYPSLHQLLSAIGAGSVAAANTVYFTLLVYFTVRKRSS